MSDVDPLDPVAGHQGPLLSGERQHRVVDVDALAVADDGALAPATGGEGDGITPQGSGRQWGQNARITPRNGLLALDSDSLLGGDWAGCRDRSECDRGRCECEGEGCQLRAHFCPFGSMTTSASSLAARPEEGLRAC